MKHPFWKWPRRGFNIQNTAGGAALSRKTRFVVAEFMGNWGLQCIGNVCFFLLFFLSAFRSYLNYYKIHSPSSVRFPSTRRALILRVGYSRGLGKWVVRVVWVRDSIRINSSRQTVQCFWLNASQVKCTLFTRTESRQNPNQKTLRFILLLSCCFTSTQTVRNRVSYVSK